MTPNVSIALLRTQTDARLTALAAAGHDRAFEAIVDRYRRPLLRYARGFSLDEGAAEDVVQASCVAAWAALRNGAAVQELRPWLYRIVHNRSINAVRAAQGINVPLVEALDGRPGPQADLESREEVRHTLDGIAALPERQRAALVAVAIDGRAHADVGEQLGVSDMAVRKLVSRARGSLRTAATAITPMPVAAWLAQVTGGAGDQAARIAEIVAVGGSAGIAGGSVLKAGALAVTIGAVAAGAPQISDHARKSERPAVARAASTTGAKPTAQNQAAVTRPDSQDDDAGPAGDRSGPGSGDGASDDDAGSREGHVRSGPPRGHGPEDDSAAPVEDQRRHPGSDRSGSGPNGSEDSPSGSDDHLPGLHEDDHLATMSDDGPGPGSEEPRRDEPGNSGRGSSGLDSSGPGSGSSRELETPEPLDPPEHPAP